MQNKEGPIGIFDSGVGGLTVLEKLMERFPNEDFIYVADQGHCPYGTKKDTEIIECALRVSKYLVEKKVKAIVIACNTASLFTEYIEKEIDVPVVSVIEPTCNMAIQVTKNKKVAVLGTIATIQKGAYQNRLHNHQIEVFGIACSEFVDFIENSSSDTVLGETLVNQKLACLKDKQLDTLIYGCTHFSILEEPIRKLLGNKIKYIACGEPTCQKLEEVFIQNQLYRNTSSHRYVKIETTGLVEQATKAMRWFKLPHESIVHIEL